MKPPGSIIDKYLKELHVRLKGEKIPEEYTRGTLWVERKYPSFILEKEAEPEELYKVSIWYPLHLKRDIICPQCDAKEGGVEVEFKENHTKPRAFHLNNEKASNINHSR
jgi:hypothetical protein